MELRWQHRGPQVSAVGDLVAWATHDVRGLLGAVECPMLVVCGEDDFWVPKPLVEETVKLLKNAEVVSVAPPNTREAELVAQRVDVIMTDFPTAIKVTDEFDWAEYLLPKEKLAVTPYAYVVPPGDQIWLNYINLFVDTIKLDGRLMQYAKKHKLDPIVAP